MRFQPQAIGLAAFLIIAFCASCSSKPQQRWVHGFEPVTTAMLKDGVAYPPKAVPLRVKKAIWAGNRINTKPYKRGGGHKSFNDWGYDCSGTVSYVLHHAGLLPSPQTSGWFRDYGRPGKGKYVTIYAKYGHVFIDIAGVRLDTGYTTRRGQGPRWSTKPRPLDGFVARHPPGL